jgi:MarR family transcriptional regulator, organic hydroperoxide resistance regulator
MKIHSVESSWQYRGLMKVDLVELFRELVRLETELWNRVEARVQQAHGLPLAWLEVMQVVSATEDCRVLDIAKALSITVGGASKVVDKVEAAGWCRRQPSPTDGRSNLIQLTEAGEGLLEAANIAFASALASDVGTAASASELDQLLATLRRLRQHLSTADPVHLAVRR